MIKGDNQIRPLSFFAQTQHEAILGEVDSDLFK